MSATLDLTSLRAFVAAATLLNFRRAAATVALSPSAFSARLKSLEDDIGAPLFERTTRRVELTPEGEALLPLAEACLAAATRCLDVRRTVAEAPYQLLIGTRHELGLSWLLPALNELAAACPPRTIHLAFANGADLVERVRRGQVDAAVTSLRIAEPDLQYAPLHEERYAFVARAEVAAALPSLAPEHIRHLTLVDIDDGLPLFRYLLDMLPPGVPPRFGRVEWMGTIAAIRQRLFDVDAVAVLPEYFVTPDLDAGALRPVLAEVEPRRDHFRLVWRSGHPKQAQLRQLASELVERPLR